MEMGTKKNKHHFLIAISVSDVFAGGYTAEDTKFNSSLQKKKYIKFILHDITYNVQNIISRTNSILYKTNRSKLDVGLTPYIWATY